jgi:hypothetical protein
LASRQDLPAPAKRRKKPATVVRSNSKTIQPGRSNPLQPRHELKTSTEDDGVLDKLLAPVGKMSCDGVSRKQIRADIKYSRLKPRLDGAPCKTQGFRKLALASIGTFPAGWRAFFLGERQQDGAAQPQQFGIANAERLCFGRPSRPGPRNLLVFHTHSARYFEKRIYRFENEQSLYQ